MLMLPSAYGRLRMPLPRVVSMLMPGSRSERFSRLSWLPTVYASMSA